MFKNKILKSKKQKIRKSKTRKRIKGGSNVKAGNAIGSMRKVTRRFTDPLNRGRYLLTRALGYNGNPLSYDYNSRARAAASSNAYSHFHKDYVKRLVDLLNDEQRQIYEYLSDNTSKIKSILDKLIEKGGNKIKIESLYKKFDKERLHYEQLILLVDISKLPNLYSIIFQSVPDTTGNGGNGGGQPVAGGNGGGQPVAGGNGGGQPVAGGGQPVAGGNGVNGNGRNVK